MHPVNLFLFMADILTRESARQIDGKEKLVLRNGETNHVYR